MKILRVQHNNRKKCFKIKTRKGWLEFPYARLRLKPTFGDRIKSVYIDKEVGFEGFTYVLESGKESTIHLDQVLEYNKDSTYLREILLYKLTLEAQKLLKRSKSSKREIIRRMGTSPMQFYRLLDQTNYGKTVDMMLKLLAALDCQVDVRFKKVA